MATETRNAGVRNATQTSEQTKALKIKRFRRNVIMFCLFMALGLVMTLKAFWPFA
ncbi:MAG: hypothetical protein QXQ87_09250 [Halobacteria archaeon]